LKKNNLSHSPEEGPYKDTLARRNIEQEPFFLKMSEDIESHSNTQDPSVTGSIQLFSSKVHCNLLDTHIPYPLLSRRQEEDYKNALA